MDATESSNSEGRKKQAACLECRKSKIKCVRTADDVICRKCKASGTACVVPAYHIGRYKGVKNKRSGLEKAISQVEEAVKRSRKSEDGLNEDQAQALEQLLKETGVTLDDQPDLVSSVCDPPRKTGIPLSSGQEPGSSSTTVKTVSFANGTNDTGELTVNNADNPLQLLAIASAIPDQSPQSHSTSSIQRAAQDVDQQTSEDGETQKFFRPLRTKLDILEDDDPLDLGLVTEEEAGRLFAHFHQNLAHTRWGMDPKIHTVDFVRARSALLLTSVLAASALFSPGAAALSKRLHNHVKTLVHNVVVSRYRSMEIVLALMINVPWMAPGSEWAADDDTCYYLSLALTIALDLSMNKIVMPSQIIRAPEIMNRISRSDCIDASKALNLDGFGDRDPASSFARRLLRTRERAWLALFNLDRGVCLARGRPPTVPTTALVSTCDSWHICETSEGQDGALVSVTVLRRDFVGLVNGIRATCDSTQLTVGSDSMTIKTMRDRIEQFFEHWLTTWKFQIQQFDGKLPPYVEILASHTKLSAYCSVIDHPTAPPDVKQFFRTAGLASALNVLKVAVQAEERLVSMPNNTVIMVSFAACFVLGLSSNTSGNTSLTALNAFNNRILIGEVAEVLQRIGQTPSHRNGASIWFGKHIKSIIQRSIGTESPLSQTARYQNTGLHATQRSMTTACVPDSLSAPPDFWNVDDNRGDIDIESFPIHDMSNDQIIELITNSKDDIDQYNANLTMDETQFLDWFPFWD